MILTKSKLFFLISILITPSTFAQQVGVDVTHYEFALSLSDQTNRISGESRIDISFAEDAPEFLLLNLISQSEGSGMNVLNISEGGSPVSYSHDNDIIRIQRTQGPGIYTYLIEYEGVPGDGLIIDRNMHGDRTFFGDNWPNRARHWIPTVDHPSDKASVEWKITAPDHYQVIANGELIEEFDVSEGMRMTHWKTEVPLPTKVMVFGAARFAVLHEGEIEDVPIQSWVYPQDREEGYYDFGVTMDMMRYFMERIGPYPYEKIANVQSKTRYGGMENASNIFYMETRITGERSNESTVAHEIAHQWFGNSVTEQDWPHIWLSEGFASYFTQLYLEYYYGRSRLVEGMLSSRNRVVAYSKRAPDSPLVDTRPMDPNEHLNTNSYQKGAWVLHMLRTKLGDEAFWKGIRNYYETYRDGNATSEQFRDIMEAASGEDLDAFFQQWLYRAGHPILDLDWSYDNSANKVTITLKQLTPDPFVFPLDIQLGSSRESILVSEEHHQWTFEHSTQPAEVNLDPDTVLLFEIMNP